MLDLRQQRLQILPIARELVVVPCRRRIGWQGDLVGEIDAGVGLRSVGAQVEIENL